MLNSGLPLAAYRRKNQASLRSALVLGDMKLGRKLMAPGRRSLVEVITGLSYRPRFVPDDISLDEVDDVLGDVCG